MTQDAQIAQMLVLAVNSWVGLANEDMHFTQGGINWPFSHPQTRFGEVSVHWRLSKTGNCKIFAIRLRDLVFQLWMKPGRYCFTRQLSGRDGLERTHYRMLRPEWIRRVRIKRLSNGRE